MAPTKERPATKTIATNREVDELCQIHGGSLALHGGVHGHDDLFHLAVTQTGQQFFHRQWVIMQPRWKS